MARLECCNDFIFLRLNRSKSKVYELHLARWKIPLNLLKNPTTEVRRREKKTWRAVRKTAHQPPRLPKSRIHGQVRSSLPRTFVFTCEFVLLHPLEKTNKLVFYPCRLSHPPASSTNNHKPPVFTLWRSRSHPLNKCREYHWAHMGVPAPRPDRTARTPCHQPHIELPRAESHEYVRC